MANPSAGNEPLPKGLSSHALEWGIGSVILGGIALACIVLGSLGGAAALIYDNQLSDVQSARDTSWVILGGTGGLMGFAGIGLIFAVLGVRHAFRTGRSAAIPATGLVMSILALSLLGLQFVSFRLACTNTVEAMTSNKVVPIAKNHLPSAFEAVATEKLQRERNAPGEHTKYEVTSWSVRFAGLTPDGAEVTAQAVATGKIVSTISANEGSENVIRFPKPVKLDIKIRFVESRRDQWLVDDVQYKEQ